jgi:Reverse transcriptase (RNA-dependent DNA polymerase)
MEAPPMLTYTNGILCDTVCIALTIEALHDLQVKTSDIQNAYLTAPVSEKIWVICGPEFGSNAGKRALIVHALHGLKSAGAAFCNHLADCMRSLGYESCLADADLWMKRVTRPNDGFEYYCYVLLYVDDILCIHHDAVSVLNEMDWYFLMKPGSIGDPDVYLGAKLQQTVLSNGVVAWGMSSSKYVQEAVKNVELYLERNYSGL